MAPTRLLAKDAAATWIARPADVGAERTPMASIEPLLQQLVHSPHDPALLDALLRCARTVQASAGSFGLDAVAGFTRHVEALLERLNAGEVRMTPELAAMLLQCNAQIRQLIDEATGSLADAAGPAQRADLVAQIQAVVTPCGLAAGADAVASSPRPLHAVQPQGTHS